MRWLQSKPSQQAGVALVSAMLVVALATTAAVSLTGTMQLSMRRSGNLYARDQAWEYLQGVEQFGMSLLKQAKDADQMGLLLGEERTLPVDGGFVTGVIVDLQAGMNINDLLTHGEGGGDKINNDYYTYIKQLLNDLGVEDNSVAAILDWIDENDELDNGNQGAEDNYYFGLESAYRAANRRMVSLSELYLIKDMDPAIVKSILNYKVDGKSQVVLSAIPKVAGEDGVTSVNINTAPERVLNAFGLDAEKIINARPWEGKLDAKSLGIETKKDKETPKIEQFLTTESNYYLLRASAKIGRTQLKSYSVIYVSDKGKMRIDSRALGTL